MPDTIAAGEENVLETAIHDIETARNTYYIIVASLPSKQMAEKQIECFHRQGVSADLQINAFGLPREKNLVLVSNYRIRMLSKNQIKRIQSLARKKGRREEGCFIAEGNKLVEDTLSVFECDLILATPSWIVSHAHESLSKIQEVDEQEMSKVSQLVTPPDVLAVYRIPEYHLNIETLKKELVLALDTVQDPGNLGTIVRLADWFGIRHIVCSPDTADLYNPKVVQATMGALARVKVYYRSLPDFLSQVDSSVVYGTFLDGEDIFNTSLTKSGVIVMGNEGNGISVKLEPYIGKRLYIPNYPVGQPTSESLNVAVAAAITCAEFRRRQIV